ncbi:FUSC family protein [uncultured Roseibium sp.]|uniref:FUSC family protein n=1 Tax=uncultured Roseibium sp. TaxID=1936171 RepID=UPI003217809D
MTARLSAYGFDPARLAFAFRTAIAASIAFVLGWLMGLEHPQWAAMTVWAASQPTRGQLWEKSLFRVLGSVVGTAVGIGLVVAMQIHPALLIVGLAAWVGACTYVGNLQRGFAAYGTVLAGYTAAMVALLDAAHPDHVLSLGGDRLATVLTGVAVATLIGSLFAPAMATGRLRQSVLELLSEMLSNAASTAQAPHERGRLLAELAAVEESLDPHGAGSLRSRQTIRSTRTLLIAATPLLLWTHGDRQPAGFRGCLAEAAAAIAGQDLAAARRALKAATTLDGVSPRFIDTLQALESALEAWHDRPEPAKARPARAILHRDWVGAREAGLRAFGALMVFGILWLATGWSVGAFMLLGLSVMISLFSTFENPSRMMRSVFVGQLLGVVGALALRWLVWPYAQAEWQMILLALPFILIGPLLIGHNKTVAVSFDYNMVLMLMSQPHWPLTGTFDASLAAGFAVAAAPLAAMLAYLTIYPANLRRRIDTVREAMLHDLHDLAADPKALDHRLHWQARLYHRILRLIRLSGRSARAQDEAESAALAVLNLGHTAMWCHRISRDETKSAAERRFARSLLARLSQNALKPARARSILSRHGIRRPGPEAGLFRDALAGLEILSGLPDKREPSRP